MTNNLKWHSCSTSDFPLKRHKVSKACELCRAKKMRCNGKTPCQRCESHKTTCVYRDKTLRQIKTKVFLLDKIQTNNGYKTQHHKTSCPLLMMNAFQLPVDTNSIPKEKEASAWMKSLIHQNIFYAPWLQHCTHSSSVTQGLLAIFLFQTSRQKEAEGLYEKAHAKFFKGCFSQESNDNIIELAILLVHYQCMAKEEQQAYLTMRMALDLAQNRELDPTLLKTLEAWYVWLTFYLGKPYYAELEAGSCQTFEYEIQRWAFDVTEAYISFLKQLVSEKKPVEIKSFEESFNALANIKTPEKHSGALEIPDKIIGLCHNILKMQLFSSAHCHNVLAISHSLLSLSVVPHAAIQAVSLVKSYCSSRNHPLYNPLVDLLTSSTCTDDHLNRLLNDLVPELSTGQKRSLLLYDSESENYDNRDKRIRLENQQESFYELLMAPERLPKLSWFPKTQWGPALQQREWNRFFAASEVQTLHYHPNMQDSKQPSLSDSSSSSPISTASHYPEHSQDLVLWDYSESTIFNQTQWISKDGWTH
ncbi:hypothetical protein BY458DRAFT_490804 [Sporodiniella umbellata]|nr:hypothetical protein BY458DRAFT_490804 [Sporodiniella umbellata]